MKLFNILLLAFLIQSAKCYALIELPDSLFKKAEQGDADAQYRLGRCYHYGEGVPKDLKQGVYWIRKAAEQGKSNAQYHLGICYRNGNGVPKDYSQALYWYRKAADQGYVDAQFRLGRCYYEGDGVTKDYTKAVFWLRKAAEQGKSNAQYHLGICYYEGNGVTKDYSQAVYWFLKAAEKGHASAQYRLGYCYHYGEGVPKDLKPAVYWYRKAAEKGHADAQYRLGYCYHYGEGVPKDLKQAVYWYRKAAEKGDLLAPYELKEINKNEISQKKNDVATSGSSSGFPNVIDISIEDASLTKIENGVETKSSVDVSLLKFYRSGLIKFGNDLKMNKLMEFDNAVVEDYLPNSAFFKNSDHPVIVSIQSTNNLIEYHLISNLDNRYILTMYCPKSESSKLKKIVQLVKQGKFIKK